MDCVEYMDQVVGSIIQGIPKKKFESRCGVWENGRCIGLYKTGYNYNWMKGRRKMMNIRKDIRMEVVNEEVAMQYIYGIVGTWIYIKHLNNTYVDDKTEQVITYTKFKVRNVDTHYGKLLIYGVEDEDRVVVDKESIICYQMTPTKDELFIQIDTGNNMTDVFIKKYLPDAKRRLDEIIETNQNLIITEGKTDWKHLKRALLYFQKRGLYKDINFVFFEYEDEIEMGADTLLKVLEYNQLFYSPGIKIFIFDADKEEINEKHKGQEFLDWGNNVYSFIIPVPDFRKDTPLISIENYYTDEEIMTCDALGRRLYINGEFNSETGRLRNDARVFDAQHGKHKKLPCNHIIEDDIFCVPETIEICNENIFKIKSECRNIALPKNHFANHIMQSVKPFDIICFDNFTLIYDVIRKIQNSSKRGKRLKQKCCVNEVEISDGIYISSFDNGLKTLEICLEETEQTLHIGKDGILQIGVKIDCDTGTFDIALYDVNYTFNIPIPLSVELLDFLEEKIHNQHNRVELHFVNKEKTSARVVEILRDSLSGAIIDKELAKIH